MNTSRINLTLGTAGHIDHGKTALIKCLTGCETDRLREEKQRGMSIELGFAPCTLGDLQVGIVDVPGHENFIKTMVAGATGIDGVIFVVAADDGVMPQTREHLDILTLLGVQKGIVALTKVDRIDAEMVELATDEVHQLLHGTFLEAAPILPVSNTTGEGFGDFITALTKLVRSAEPRRVDGVFRMPVERAFSVSGYGTIISGIPEAGSISVGDEVELLPQGLKSTIRATQVYGQDSETVLAGQCSALNVRHLDHRVIERGNVIATPGFFKPTEWCVCSLNLLEHERFTMKNGAKMKFHTGTVETIASVYLLEGNHASAGDRCYAQVRFDQPMIVGPGDRYVVRSLSPVRSVGGGTIIEATPYRLRRNRPGMIEELAARADAVVEPTRFIEYCVRKADGYAVQPNALSLRTKVPMAGLIQRLDDLKSSGCVIEVSSGWLMHVDTMSELSLQAIDMLGRYHGEHPDSPGIGRDGLAEMCGWSDCVRDAMVGRLLADGGCVENSHRLALPTHGDQMSDEKRELLDQAEHLYGRRLFQPPSADELAVALGIGAADTAEVVGMLRERERLVEVTAGLFFHVDAITEARSRLTAYIDEHGELESVQFKYLLDTTRKFAIPLLDYFDRTNVTLRRGNTRLLRPGATNRK